MEAQNRTDLFCPARHISTLNVAHQTRENQQSRRQVSRTILQQHLAEERCGSPVRNDLTTNVQKPRGDRRLTDVTIAICNNQILASDSAQLSAKLLLCFVMRAVDGRAGTLYRPSRQNTI